MAIASPWTYFALMTVVLGLLCLPAFGFVDAASPVRARFVALDGLRGFAALGVFAFHVVVTHRFVATGEWQPPMSGFYALVGPLGVSLFFMITGFLFWTKLLSGSERGCWRALYVGRLFRIAPMYLFVVAAMLAIVLAKTGFALHEPLRDVVGAALQWLALGIVNLQPDVNGYPATHVLAGVTWTISYEWAFYASLLATAAVARSRAHLPIVVGALAVCLAGKALLHSGVLGFAALFLCGMTVASLLHEKRMAPLSDRAGSALALACLLLIFAGSQLAESLSGYGTPATLLMAGFFYLVCSGATLFGVLTARPAQRLGSISYSVYLLQGIVLALVFAVPALAEFALRTPGNYWLIGMLCACVLVVAASLTYYFVELPAIRVGKRFARQPGAPVTGTTPRRVERPAALRARSQPAPISAADP